MGRVRQYEILRIAALIAPSFTTPIAVNAQIMPIAPFQGEISEDFESRCPCPSSFFCVPGGIFGGLAELCANQGYVALESRGLCDLMPHSGRVLFGVAVNPSEGVHLTMRKPVDRFGGMFAQVHKSPGGVVLTFVNETGELIGRDIVKFDGDCTWRWAGWESTVPIMSVHMTGFRVVGPFNESDEFNIDDLQARLASSTCYPDCDTSTGPGILDIFDFLCFGNRFTAGDPYACDCDTSTGVGICDIFDFLCFGNAFNAGCQ